MIEDSFFFVIVFPINIKQEMRRKEGGAENKGTMARRVSFDFPFRFTAGTLRNVTKLPRGLRGVTTRLWRLRMSLGRALRLVLGRIF